MFLATALNCIIYKCHSLVCSIGYIFDKNSSNASCVPRVRAVILKKQCDVCCFLFEEWRLDFFLEGLEFIDGTLKYSGDYVSGRNMKTTIIYTPGGLVTLDTSVLKMSVLIQEKTRQVELHQ